jgi:hypothetical protein
MTLTERLALVRLALNAIREGRAANLDLARGCLVEALDGLDDAQPAPVADELVTITQAAKALSFSSRHLRSLIKSGRLGDGAVGTGRATRISIPRAVAALQRNGTSIPRQEPEDVVARELQAFKRREGMRVIGGGRT